jgi:hypothetical protein
MPAAMVDISRANKKAGIYPAILSGNQKIGGSQAAPK